MTECDLCMKREVCKYKEEIKEVERLKQIKAISIDVTCKEYARELDLYENLLDDMLYGIGQKAMMPAGKYDLHEIAMGIIIRLHDMHDSDCTECPFYLDSGDCIFQNSKMIEIQGDTRGLNYGAIEPMLYKNRPEQEE